jgi:hypothetical protein
MSECKSEGMSECKSERMSECKSEGISERKSEGMSECIIRIGMWRKACRKARCLGFGGNLTVLRSSFRVMPLLIP